MTISWVSQEGRADAPSANVGIGLGEAVLKGLVVGGGPGSGVCVPQATSMEAAHGLNVDDLGGFKLELSCTKLP